MSQKRKLFIQFLLMKEAIQAKTKASLYESEDAISHDFEPSKTTVLG
jgi:hypothetical protein